MLSELDKQLLKKLSLEPKLTTSALAASLSTSQPVIWRRIKRLEGLGVIKGKRLLLNQELLGFGVKVSGDVNTTALGSPLFHNCAVPNLL